MFAGMLSLSWIIVSRGNQHTRDNTLAFVSVHDQYYDDGAIFLMCTQSLRIAEPLNGPWMRKYMELARTHNIMLSLGGFQEAGPDADHLFNTHVLVSPSGDITATYRKVYESHDSFVCVYVFLFSLH